MLVKCKIAYTDKTDNMKYLLEWINEDNLHIKHIYKELNEQGYDVMLKQE